MHVISLHIALAVSKFKIEFLNIFFSLPLSTFWKKNIFGYFSTLYFILLKTKIVVYSVNLNSCPFDTNFQFDEENNRKLDQCNFFSNLALDRQFFICSMYLSRISLFVISIRVIKEKVVVFKSPFSHKIEFWLHPIFFIIFLLNILKYT